SHGSVEAGKWRTDMRYRRGGDFRREGTRGTIVDVAFRVASAELRPEACRARQRLRDALGTDTPLDPAGRRELPVQPARDHHRVDSGLDAGHDDVLHRDASDAAHVERVGDAESAEAEVGPEQVGEDRA